MMVQLSGAEYGEATGARQQATRPGNGLEAGPVGVGDTAIAFPSRDGHHALESDLVRHLREPEVVLPAGLPALRERGVGSPARAICAEEPESETVAVHEGGVAWAHKARSPPPRQRQLPQREDSPSKGSFRGGRCVAFSDVE